jgi:hypothetical protein
MGKALWRTADEGWLRISSTAVSRPPVDKNASEIKMISLGLLADECGIEDT